MCSSFGEECSPGISEVPSPTLSEKVAQPNVYHHLSKLSVDIQLNGLINSRSASHSKFQNEADPGDFPFTQLDIPESGALRQWTPVISK